MVIAKFQEFNEMISFLSSGKKSNHTPSRVGLVVAIDSNFKTSDGYKLTHIYQISSEENGVVKASFIGNFKKSDSKKSQLSLGRLILKSEPISDFRLLTKEEISDISDKFPKSSHLHKFPKFKFE